MSQSPHVLIRASAGTGKTFQLANRYLRLLLEGAAPDQILAATFTRKAAGEILERIVRRLAAAVLDSRQRAELGDAVGLRLSGRRCAECLTRLVRRLHRLRIGTLDSFYAQLARSFSLELDLPAGWRICDELEDQQLRAAAVEAVLREGDARDVRRLARLIAKGEAVRSVAATVQETVDQLYDVFCETEAEAWRRRGGGAPLSSEQLTQLLGELAALEPADRRLAAALNRGLEQAASGDWEAVAANGLVANVLRGETQYYRKDIPPDVLDRCRRLGRHARAVVLRQIAQQTEATYELLARFDERYGRAKRRARGLRFADVTRSLGRYAAAVDLAEQTFRLDAPLAHMLLDEFQDTSPAQWRVLRPFARRITAAGARCGEGPPPSFFCVGDAKQAIYGWRGGRAELFDALEEELPGLRPTELVQSYRSAPPVIDLVNRVFAGVSRHPNLGRLEDAVREWSRRFPPHTTARRKEPGHVRLETAPAPGEGEDVHDALWCWTARRIAQLRGEAPGRSIGVLVRKNDTVTRLVFEIRKKEIAASEEGGGPLTDSAAVQLLASLLVLADHPGDGPARFHLAHSPLAEALQLRDHEDDQAAWRAASRLRRSLVEEGYGATIMEWAGILAPYCSPRDRSRLQQLVEMAYQYEPAASLRTRDFIETVASRRVPDPTPADVRVMTFHQAKGLQFDAVVLPELDYSLVGQPPACVAGSPSPIEPPDRVCVYRKEALQQLLPGSLQELFERHTRERVMEALCVLYVALTRAKHAVYMIGPPSRPNERSLPKTPWGLLRAALTDGRSLGPERVAYEQGDPRWAEAGKEARRPAASGAAEPAPSRVRLAPVAAGAWRGLELTAPSKLEGGSRLEAGRVLALESAGARSYGSLLHAWFETIAWLEDGAAEEAELRRIAERLGAPAGQLDQLLDRFRQMLNQPEIAAALSRRSYADAADPGWKRLLPPDAAPQRVELAVLREQRFAVRQDRRLIVGAVDRLVLARHDGQAVAADVLDYKTDAAPPDQRAGLIEHYRPQLEAYRQAVAALFRLPLDRVGARLLLVSLGQAPRLFPD